MYQHVYYLMRLTCFWTTDSEQPSLIVHVQRGLSNRLLALASAASVAAAVGMPLKLIWLSDQYCEATFSNLFRLRDELSAQSLRSLNSSALLSVSQLRSQDVWESSTSLPAVQLLSSSRYELYNYMEPEEGAIKNKPIEIASGSRRKSVYIKSADRLSHDAGLDDANLHHALSSLVLSEALQHTSARCVSAGWEKRASVSQLTRAACMWRLWIQPLACTSAISRRGKRQRTRIPTSISCSRQPANSARPTSMLVHCSVPRRSHNSASTCPPTTRPLSQN